MIKVCSLLGLNPPVSIPVKFAFALIPVVVFQLSSTVHWALCPLFLGATFGLPQLYD